jgi:regulator of extracellular matrix RemA (YlzA/DUF370 family)
MLHIGNGNYVATAGKKTRSLLHLVDGFVVSSSISPEALISRIDK